MWGVPALSIGPIWSKQWETEIKYIKRGWQRGSPTECNEKIWWLEEKISICVIDRHCKFDISQTNQSKVSWGVNVFRGLNDVTVNNKDQGIYSSYYLIDIIHFIILYIKEWLPQVTYNQKFAKICHWSYSRRIQEQEVNSVLEQEEKSILMTQKLLMEQSILRTGFLSCPRTYFIK